MTQTLKLAYLNAVTIIGRLVADPHPLKAAGEREGSAFVVAVNRQTGREKKPVTAFIDVICWGDVATACNKFLGKGSAVMVSGSLQNHEQKREKGAPIKMLQVSASAVQFLSSAPEVPADPSS